MTPHLTIFWYTVKQMIMYPTRQYLQVTSMDNFDMTSLAPWSKAVFTFSIANALPPKIHTVLPLNVLCSSPNKAFELNATMPWNLFSPRKMKSFLIVCEPVAMKTILHT